MSVKKGSQFSQRRVTSHDRHADPAYRQSPITSAVVGVGPSQPWGAIQRRPARSRTTESCSIAKSMPTWHCRRVGVRTSGGKIASLRTIGLPLRLQERRVWPSRVRRYTRSFLLRAARKAAPSSLAQRLCGTPLRLKGDIRVKSGRPSATTSNRRANARWGGSRSRSRTSTFVDTRAPAFQSIPPTTQHPCAQAARWWPLGSSGRPYRQKREEGGTGSQRRRRSSMRNKEESSLDKRDVGKHKNGTPANGPPCDLKSACSVTESLGLTVPSMRIPRTGSVAVRCHPWRGMPGSMSTSCTR